MGAPPYLVFFSECLSRICEEPLRPSVIRDVKNRTSNERATAVLCNNICSLLGGKEELGGASQALLLLRERGYFRAQLQAGLPVERLNVELLIALGFMMFKLKVFDCMHPNDKRKWWRDSTVMTLLEEQRGRRDRGEEPALIDRTEQPLSVDGLRSLTHVLKAKSRHIRGLSSVVSEPADYKYKGKKGTGKAASSTRLESYCCNIAWSDSVSRLKAEFEAENRRFLQRSYITSIGKYLNSLLSETDEVEATTDDSESLVGAFRTEMDRRADIADWLERSAGGGQGVDYEALVSSLISFRPVVVF